MSIAPASAPAGGRRGPLRREPGAALTSAGRARPGSRNPRGPSSRLVSAAPPGRTPGGRGLGCPGEGTGVLGGYWGARGAGVMGPGG